MCPSLERHAKDRPLNAERLDLLRDHIRSSFRMARVLLDEVLDPGFSEHEPEEYRKLVIKAGSELAMLLRLAKRALPGDEDAEEIRALARDLAPLVRTPFVYRCLLMRPSRAPMYALAHLCLVGLEVPDEKLDRVVHMAMRSSVCAANERVPYRLLDAAWTRHIAFGDAELNHPAIELSPLGVGVDLLEASTEDAYAYTHSLPYATDFGRIPLPDSLDRRALLLFAEAIALKALDEDDLDLLAEVLMAPAVLRLDWTPTMSFAWEVLERVWQEFGFVPGPGLPPPADNETRTQQVRRVLGTTYHTSFAAGLCCATLIACNAAPPYPDFGTPGRIDPPPGKGAMWKINWHACPRHVQEGLDFLTIGFSLRRAIEAMDFVRVRQVLKLAAEAGLIEHPFFTQALELLERATV